LRRIVEKKKGLGERRRTFFVETGEGLGAEEERPR
jgi:hypothetical protein